MNAGGVWAGLRAGLRRAQGWTLGALALCFVAGCDPVKAPGPDARVELYAVDRDALSSSADAASSSWLEAVANAHERADAAVGRGDTAAALVELEGALARSAPTDDAVAPLVQIVRLDLAARFGELQPSTPDGASETIARLRPMLNPERALPLDSASARALVVMGDAASLVDDHALAAGSYARAVKVMSKLRAAEAERVLGEEAAR